MNFTTFYFYNFDYSFNLLFLFLLANFLFFFVILMSDFMVFKQGYQYFGKKNTTFENSFILTKVVLQFYIFVSLVSVIVFTFVFFFVGNLVFSPHGSYFLLNTSVLFCVCLVNFFLLFFVCMFYFRFSDLKKTRVSFFFKLEEFFLFNFLNFISFFFFSSQDFLSFFICLEIVSFIFYVYTGLQGTTKPFFTATKYSINSRIVEASLKYLVPGLFSSLLFLSGVYVIYFSTGILFFQELVCFLKNVNFSLFNEFSLFFGFFLLLSSFCFKLSVAPFHSWILWVYDGALQHVVFFLSTVSKFFYFLVFLKLIFPFFLFIPNFNFLFIVLGFFSIFLSTFFGLFELRFNSLLAYSGILNMGYSFLALGIFSHNGATIALFLFFFYCLLSLILYSFIIRAQAMRSGFFLETIADFKALSFFDFKLFLFLVVTIFAIIGIPPLPGFYPKLLLFFNFFFCFNSVLAVLVLFCVVLSSFFYMRWIVNLNLGLTISTTRFWINKSVGNFSTIYAYSLLLFLFFFSSPVVCDMLLAFLQICLVC